MSNPNTIVAASQASSSSRNRFQFGQTKTLSIGKDSFEVETMVMASPASDDFMRSACFDYLTRTLTDNYPSISTTDIMTTISSELPISTTAAAESAHNACTPLLSAPYNIKYLTPRGFFNHHGNTIALTKDFDTKRPADVYFASFDCTIPPTDFDARITQAPFSFTFYLRLPQTTKSVPSSIPPHSIDTTTTSASNPAPTATTDEPEHTTSSPPKLSPTSASHFSHILSQLNSDADDFDVNTARLHLSALKDSFIDKTKQLHHRHNTSSATPSQPSFGAASSSISSDPSSSHQSTTFSTLSSPKMSSLVASSASSITSFHGSLAFADCQSTFFHTFGHKPLLLHVTKRSNLKAGDSLEDSQTIHTLLRDFFTRCKLDVFIAICRSDYVGSNYLADDHKAVQVICDRILHYKMQFTHGSITRTIHPNDLYSKYLSLVSTLPTDPSKWTIILCSTYFNALTKELQEKMTEDNFTMPTLTTLVSKADHLNALREVKELASTSYKNLLNEQKRLQKLIHSTNSTATSAFHSSQPPTATLSSPASQPVYQYSSNSQAETTLQRYSYPPVPASNSSAPSHSNSAKGPPPPTITKPDGLQYPYEINNPSNVSDYPITFRGCYGCGNTTHMWGDACPSRSIPGTSKVFWRNLWLHKPWTKKRPSNTQSTNTSSSSHYGPATPNPPSGTINQYQSAQLPPTPSQHQPPPPHGLGRGHAATAPAWMTQQQQQQSTAPAPAPIPDPAPASVPAPAPAPGSDPSFHHEDRVNKKHRLWVVTAQPVFNQSSAMIRQMPLDVDNGLPAIAVRFGPPTTNNESPVIFLCHIDSCAAMNTGNLRLHQWIMSNHPHIVAEYIQYDDANPFEPLHLNCAVSGAEQERLKTELSNSLTAIVRYHTPYTFTDGSPVIISFGLGENVAVNSILGMPTIQNWKADLLFSSSTLSAPALRTTFPLEYSIADGGLPDNIKFESSQFTRPNTSSSSSSNALCANLSSAAITDSDRFNNPPSSDCIITEDSSNGYLRRQVQLKSSS